ncbi:MAG: hypothetical protein JXL84_04775 [Deltaproteobacteria bacterium]|nr:hypothetical protein [Deltaproteobacteria bacterium]
MKRARNPEKRYIAYRETLQKDIPPLIRKEIERLKKWLRDLPLKREEEKHEPIRTRAQGFPVFSLHQRMKETSCYFL